MEHRHLEFEPVAVTSGPEGRRDFGLNVSRSAEVLLPPHKCGGCHMGPPTPIPLFPAITRTPAGVLKVDRNSYDRRRDRRGTGCKVRAGMAAHGSFGEKAQASKMASSTRSAASWL